jgi:cytochrome oxidase assembly protein ShyY1
VTGWRVVLTRRWLGYLAVAVVFAIACGFLSNWQLNRGREAAAANDLIEANFHRDPVPLEQAITSLDGFRADQEWLRVRVTGSYLPGEELLVRNRPTAQGPGFEVLTPLLLADGSRFIVDRGWVPTGSEQDAPDSVPAPPAGQVSVIVRLKPTEPHLTARTAAGDQIASIDLRAIRDRLGGAVYTGAYGVLDTQTPQPAQALTPIVTSEPTQDEGLHWSYMIQWIIFALIAFFGLGYAVRQEYRLRREDDEELPAARPRRAVRKTDAEIEDELLDSALR